MGCALRCLRAVLPRAQVRGLGLPRGCAVNGGGWNWLGLHSCSGHFLLTSPRPAHPLPLTHRDAAAALFFLSGLRPHFVDPWHHTLSILSLAAFTQTPSCFFIKSNRRDAVTALAFRDGTHTLLSGSADRTVKLWSLDDRAYMDTLFGHQVCVSRVSFACRGCGGCRCVHKS